MDRKTILETAKTIVTGEREDQYGSPEDNFAAIAYMWTAYLRKTIEPEDVAAMMILLKVARIGSGHYKEDNWVDVAGYAACGGEIASERAMERICNFCGEVVNEVAQSGLQSAT